MSGTIDVTSIAVPNNGQGIGAGVGTESISTKRTKTRRRIKRKSKRCDACLSFISLQLAGLGFIASLSSTSTCSYLQVNGAPEDENSLLGIWEMHSNNTTGLFSCQPYPSDAPFDDHFRTSRAMSVLAPLFCFAGMCASYFAEAGPPLYQERRVLISILLLLIASVMQALTLMILESEVCLNNPLIPGNGSCGRDVGSNVSIGAASFMMASCFTLLITGKKEVEYDTNDPSTAQTLDPSIRQMGSNQASERLGESDSGTGEPKLPLKHGTGKTKFVDIWGKLV